ncbi:iron complex transport system substrate-binding protein [Rhodoblastus acidophilus]|uniref:Iron complex transport system substrate-binding protein n=1 Tax=Rhodoblastus acidophilus TaxID=1074 RepID=A0A212SDV9_RHOAC|nr:ABC transporter substrate-binding protein [Rhodoblastus acidophilus]SNB83635.1 iron complex transport system substrate-binding protein [Rhodoblastus acidophilus]
MRGLIALLALLCCGAQAGELTDLGGRKVTPPDKIARVACLEVLCYPTLLMLGVEDRVAIMVQTAAPWLQATNARTAQIARVGTEADVEDLAARKIDIAFIAYNVARIAPKLDKVGLPTLISQRVGQSPQTEQAFVDNAQAMVRQFGRVFGGETERRAEDYCAWFDDKRAMVAARIADIPPEQRRKLFYVRGPRSQNAQGRFGYVYWLGTLAGARMVGADAPLAGNGPANMEDLLQADPDVVIVGRQYPVALVLDDPRWRTVAAVRNGEVHASPAGVFYWDGGPESALMMLFIAKTLYPDRFADLDMIAEIKGFYARFYRFALTDDQAGKILRGETPEGARFMKVNN